MSTGKVLRCTEVGGGGGVAAKGLNSANEA